MFLRYEWYPYGKIDWAHAETLAFASILNDGTPIRLTGQDSERGTFAQRNIMLHDSVNGKTYSPLHTLETAKASFAVHNSPLTETAVLAYEYGYNVFAPETLVLWEGQFGDFANTAQVIFDQFIAAGRAKWGQRSGLVMLLPLNQSLMESFNNYQKKVIFTLIGTSIQQMASVLR